MTRIIESLAEIGGQYDVLYCDLWGCLHNGCELYPPPLPRCRIFAPAAAPWR
jgi:hypothetical protein